jgi:hypothetical protein
MSRSDYPLFSKRIQKSQKNWRGGYNFEKSKEYELAEKWFEERRGIKQSITPKVENTTEKIRVSKSEPKKLPPGLEVLIKKNIIDDCELDVIIPSYDDFNYTNPDDTLLSFPIDSNIFDIFNIQYSTPLFIEE